MLFKRKPPIWQWDDRFSIYSHNIPGTAFTHKYTYIIPSDRHVHLIAGSWHIILANLGTPRQVRVFCWRAEHFLYAPVFGQQQTANTTIQETFGTYGYPVSYLVEPKCIIRSMIPFCFLYPDDRITIELVNPQLGDYLVSIHFTFKSWNI